MFGLKLRRTPANDLEEVAAGPLTPTMAEAVAELSESADSDAHRRDRLLSGLNLLLAAIVLLGAPFALQAGSVFFLPLAAAIVIGLILIPGLEWLERRRIPTALAALLAVILFVAAANLILVSIIIPAIDWVQLLPKQLDQVRDNLSPILNTLGDAENFARRIGRSFGVNAEFETAMLGVPVIVAGFAGAAPSALFQFLYTLLLAYFLLMTYAGIRDGILKGHARPTGASQLTRLMRDVVRSTAAYIFTISAVNLALGAAVSLMAWAFGLPTPLMWGGFAALFNFVPYAGPVLVGLLLLLGGLVSLGSAFEAMLPALAFLGMHMVEANIITPALVGRRLTINPVLILLSLSFWGWVWGAVGALLSVPLLIMARVFIHHVGAPDLLGFLFRDGTLVHEEADQKRA